MGRLSCSIMGHSPQRFRFRYNEEAPLCKKIKEALQGQIQLLYSQGVRVFYVDCSVGVDTWCAEIVLRLQQQNDYSEIELFCAIPFPEQAGRFTAGQKKRHQKILESCTYNKKVGKAYSPTVYKRCNYYMIDHSQYLLAVYDQSKDDRNIASAVNYATKKGLQIVLVHPDTAAVEQLFHR